MKIIKLVSIISLMIAILLTGCGGGGKSTYTNTLPDIVGYAPKEESPNVSMEMQAYNLLEDYIAYDSIECPYSELFALGEALDNKSSVDFNVEKHTFDFLSGAASVDANKLFEVIKANNKEFMNGKNKHFYEEFSDSVLKDYVETVSRTINEKLSQVKDNGSLSCVLGNLKILNMNTSNYGHYDYKTGVLCVSPEMISAKEDRDNDEKYGDKTLSHETMHILQSICSDVPHNENDFCMGTSYKFETLSVNSLKLSWLYESSAEVNTAAMYGEQPSTYFTMIDKLDTIGVAILANESFKAGLLENICFSRDDEAMYAMTGFADRKKAMEFLYAVEIMCTKPEDFISAYEGKYGKEDDYSEFLTKIYAPYFIETVSKLFYKNLAYRLTGTQMNENDVFYLVSVFENRLMNYIPFSNSAVMEQYKETYEKYIELQNRFFSSIKTENDADITESYRLYEANYNDNGIYANASLEWLDTEKKDYLLGENAELKKNGIKKMIDCVQ